jgi:hypothetical protein
VHVDIKKLGRIPRGDGWRIHGRAEVAGHQSHKKHKIGYAFVHAAVDGYSRLAYSEVLDDERGAPPPSGSGPRSSSLPTASPSSGS